MVSLTIGALFAQTNRMSYQAVVRNANNELVYNENVSVQVEILNASGVVQYSERHTTTTNANGMLSLTIGGGTHVEGTFANIVWQDAVIRSLFTLADGATVTQTTPVTAVPYALYAENAGNAFSGDYNDLENRPPIPTVPEDVSAFNNDAGYITVVDIPDETDPTVPSWAKAETKPTYDYSEIENTPQIPQVPEDVSVFNNDAGYITAADIPAIPIVPADVSAFNNDAHYVSNALCDTVDICSLMGIINQLQARISELEDKINSEDTPTTEPDQPTPSTVDGQPCPNAPTVVDYDGNVYNTVLIGQQCWMNKNLRTTHYTNGDTILLGNVRTYPNNDPNNVAEYGYLYNWYATMHLDNSYQGSALDTQGICPTGWHVPSYDEWGILSNYAGQNYWGLIALTGFSTQLAGRYWDGYRNFGEKNYFWTRDYIVNQSVAYRCMDADMNLSSNGETENAHAGYSVRCLKDDPNSANPENPTAGGTTTSDGVACPNNPTVTDVDGNTYNTIQFGTQCWMAENLRTIPTNAIYGVQGNTIRDAVDIGYYYYPNNNNELVSQYGLLYNWTAATGGANDFQGTVQGVCPNGWHLPGYADYSQFRQYMDTATYNNVANGYRCNISFSIAKSLAHASNWIESDVVCAPGNNISTNNASGFDAPASGYVWYANYVDYNKRATFWTATEHNNDVTAGYYFGINHDREDAYLSFDNKGNGRSIRCIRN